MTKPLEHVEYLSKEIGARPAGTEEEQNAALYIADQLQKEANFQQDRWANQTTRPSPQEQA